MVVLAACLAPLHAMAAFECNVKITYVLVYAKGEVNVRHSGRNDLTVMCNLNSDYGGVSPLVCASWYAMVMQIKKKNGIANFYYPGTGSCETMLTYGEAPVPSYVGDLTP